MPEKIFEHELSGIQPELESTFDVENQDRRNIDQYSATQYDDLLKTYADHPVNNPRIRYARDFEGYDMATPQVHNKINSESMTESNYLKQFVDQFPLLDGKDHEVEICKRIELGMEAYQALHNQDDLPSDRKEELEQLAIYGAGSFTTMYESNLRMVRLIAAKQIFTSSYSMNDAFQDGCIGLRRAIQKFDYRKGWKFSTYAYKWITQSINRGADEVTYDVRIGNSARVRCSHVLDEIYKAEEKDMRVSDQQLINLGFKDYEVRAARSFLYQNRLSIDATNGDENPTSLADKLTDKDVDFDSSLQQQDIAMEIGELVNRNGVQQQHLQVFSLLYGVKLGGVDYNKQLCVDGFGFISLDEYLSLIRDGNATPPDRYQISELFDLSPSQIGNIDRQSRTMILREASLDIIAEELDLDYSDRIVLGGYFVLGKFKKYLRGQPNSSIANSKDPAKEVIQLIRQYPADFDDVLCKTLDSLQNELHYSVDQINSAEAWLGARLGYNTVDTIPTEHRDRKNLGLPRVFIEQVDTNYLANLTGVWGKAPNFGNSSE